MRKTDVAVVLLSLVALITGFFRVNAQTAGQAPAAPTANGVAAVGKFESVKFPQAIREGKQPLRSFENTDTFPAHDYRVEFKKIRWKG